MTPTANRGPGAQQVPDVCVRIPVKRPDGELVYRANPEQARRLIESGWCTEEKHHRSVFLRMKSNPPAKGFTSCSAQANFTVSQIANLFEHIQSKQKGL